MRVGINTSCGRFDGSSASISRAATVIVVLLYAVGDIDFCVYIIHIYAMQRADSATG